MTNIGSKWSEIVLIQKYAGTENLSHLPQMQALFPKIFMRKVTS